VDYLVISHFHSDHMGAVPELARLLKFKTVLDRGWPDYNEAAPFIGELADRYKAALKDQKERHGAKPELFKAGRADQIVLRLEPAKYSNFEVRNIAANGEIWTGAGTQARQRMPAAEVPNENCSSIAMRIRYGGFDYFSGGDLPGVPGGETSRKMPLLAARRPPPDWLDMESPIAWVTGPVDVLVLNHHGGQDTTNPFFLSVLQPRVHIAQVWDSIQVTAEVLRRIRSQTIYPGPRDVFTTNGMWEGKKEHMIEFYGEEVALRHAEDLQNLAASQGHIVVRVALNGASYQVFVLNDSQETYRIRSVHGPYESR
jgi:beta-lactamase superfamily II metal-dependent hydrolase